MTEQESIDDAKSAMRNHDVTMWPCVIEPNGWKGINKTFDIDGYQVIIVDPTGVVVNPDAYSDDFEVGVKEALAVSR